MGCRLWGHKELDMTEVMQQQAEGNWGYSRYLRVTALGDLVFLGVKGLVVPEADEMRAPFKLGPRFFKAHGIWSLSPWNLKPSG